MRFVILMVADGRPHFKQPGVTRKLSEMTDSATKWKAYSAFPKLGFFGASFPVIH